MADFHWILGPCSVESRKTYFTAADALAPLMQGRSWLLKASFDKANRSALHGKRGPGFEEAVEIFHEVRQRHPEVRLITDVHECHQVEPLKGIVDVIQVPAFLARQTDLLVECGKHFSKVFVKRPQFLDPESTCYIPDKVRSQNPNVEVWVAERGSVFGYGHLTVDFGAVPEFHKAFDRVYLDCTHSTQRKKPNGFTGGDRSLAERYMLATPILGYNGIFAETHPNPPEAISDGDCQVYLRRMKRLVEAHDAVRALVSESKVFE